MRTHEIRERFLTYFEDHGHHRLASASLITHDDPSLLFTVAGMVPLKPYITGELEPPSPRLVSCQKCFRGQGLNDDIAEVGDDTHQTFFEMLGNWSIGDYFKEGAISLAWELLTGDFGLPPARLWPSIYPDDEESERLWRGIGVPDDRIARFTDNWWQAGPTGPCGYDSEIYWDWGGPCSCGRGDCRPDDGCGGDRWVEIWNLVLMEFNQDEQGVRSPLPRRTVDTGMGLERMAAVLQGVRSNYQTDVFQGIIDSFAARASDAAPAPQRTASLHVLADHVRAASFLVADGILPGTESRGYVLRRVIRRAAVHGRRLGLSGGLWPGVGAVVDSMGEAYPEIVQSRELIESTLRFEEEAFARTLDAGSERLDNLLASGPGTIPGEEAFRLHDTFGLPIEVTVELAGERGVAVDREGFAAAMAEQRARSRAAHVRVGFEGGPQLPSTRFVGYEALECTATVLRIGTGGEVDRLTPDGGEDAVILDTSPFYAEAGGQVGDTGQLVWETGWATVLDSTYAGAARVLTVRVEEGELTVGSRVLATVDDVRRGRVSRHHSATHFLNQSLREVLGPGVVQRGSFVGPEHTTFDFSFSRALIADEVREVERRVNDHVRTNQRRSVEVMPLPAARASGAIALLDERYSEDVRVVDFGGWSRELCGGTHVHRSGDVGAAIIVSESSIGQGVRRIEMVAGEAAEQRWRSVGDALTTAARALKAPPAEVPERVAALQEQLRTARRELEQARRRNATLPGSAGPTVAIVDVGGIRVAGLVVDALANTVIDTADRLYAEQLGGDGVAAVVGTDTLAVKLGATARAAGLRAGALAEEAAARTGGKGGGRDDFARGSVKDPLKRDAALRLIRERVGAAAGAGAA